MRYIDDENDLEYEKVEVGEWKGHVVVWRAAIFRSRAIGNTEKSSIQVVDVIRMTGGSMWQGVESEMLLKYTGTADKSYEYDENEHFADQGMTKQKIGSH